MAKRRGVEAGSRVAFRDGGGTASGIGFVNRTRQSRLGHPGRATATAKPLARWNAWVAARSMAQTRVTCSSGNMPAYNSGRPASPAEGIQRLPQTAHERGTVIDQDLLGRIVRELIGRRSEGVYWDFKLRHHAEKSDLIHDVLCLVNAEYDGPRFLVFGVRDGDWSLHSIENDPGRRR